MVGFGGWVSQSVNFTVTATRRVPLVSTDGRRLIEARDLQGTVDLNSGDGRIVASNLDGQLKAHTGDGSIDIDRSLVAWMPTPATARSRSRAVWMN